MKKTTKDRELRALHALHASVGRSQGDPRFHALLREIGQLHDRKQRDYGIEGDAFAGYRQPATAIGLSPWKSPFLRLCEKVIRVQNFALKGELANEAAEDSLQDISVLALICLILLSEEKGR